MKEVVIQILQEPEVNVKSENEKLEEGLKKTKTSFFGKLARTFASHFLLKIMFQI